ncbi:MAG: L-seryl-tRNA(Sec) selenium transferase [Eggerthellaceae bacterium]|nr:L-seryl-tRNA(Sec) selenium transferase [Eggerthellaceae bacterium]
MADQSIQEALRSLPSVEEILQNLSLNKKNALFADLPHALKADIIRKEIDARRSAILASQQADTDASSITEAVIDQLELQANPSLRRVVNATGIIVHTNLGRSVLADEALASVIEVAKGYSTLEYDTQAMERGSRHIHYEELICALTGAEAAIAVNNNAAAVMMVLHEFAQNKQAIISRGELIEIGGSFRIPDIMDFSHAHMVEVGTTNKTHLSDYANAITNDTAMLLKVHTSNYRLVGFTESVDIKDLRKLADAVNNQRNSSAAQMAHAAQAPYSAQASHTTQAPFSAQTPHTAQTSFSTQAPLSTQAPYAMYGQSSQPSPEPLLVYEDLGSGLFIRPKWLTADQEPTVSESLCQGCDLLSFSGDKLLGGPQAGIIVGKKELIDRLKKNPLARALRLDKMTIAALEATLRLYLDPNKAMKAIPTLKMLCTMPEEIQETANKLKTALDQSEASKAADFKVTQDISRSGGGSLPMLDIPTYCVEVVFKGRSSAQECMEYLVQKRCRPVIGRITHQKLLFDARTLIDENDLNEIVSGMSEYARQGTSENTLHKTSGNPHQNTSEHATQV